MKRSFLRTSLTYVAAITGVAASVYTTAYLVNENNVPPEVRDAAQWTGMRTTEVWAGILANPGPVVVAAVTFLLTVVYHIARGASLRESVEVAATKVRVIREEKSDSDVVRKVKNRTTAQHLANERIDIYNRLGALGGLLATAREYEVHTRQEREFAALVLDEKTSKYQKACEELDTLEREEMTLRQQDADLIAALKELGVDAPKSG